MIHNNITFIPDLVHTQVFGEQLHTFSSTSCERTYRCLVDVVHVGGSSAACPDGVLAQRKEVLSRSRQDTGLILGGFYSQSRGAAWPLPGQKPASPPFVPQRVSISCASAYVCHFGQSVTITGLR